MDGNFGARLRQRREEQGIDLIAIAAQTKIKMSLLEGLERDDVSHWPSGIFRRAYIRTYAQAIALDPDAVLREFLEVYPEPAEVVTTEAIASVVDSARSQAGPPTRLRYIVGSAFHSLTRFRRAPMEEMQPAPGLRLDVPRGVTFARAESALVPTPKSDQEPMDLAAALMAELVEHEPAPIEAAESDSDALEVDLPAPVAEAIEPPAPVPLAPQFDGPDFLALAHVCTEFGQVQDAGALAPLLGQAAGILGARGMILWLWDPIAGGLRAALAHGYSDRVLAQLPMVGRDAENATAAAFRRGQTCTTAGAAHTNSAVVLPLLTGAGCAGVLAVELPEGQEQQPSVRAAATILAAMLAQLASAPAADRDEVEPDPVMAQAEPDMTLASARYRA
jgi:transcriptional regulator with XRE-family HTH domain